MIPIKQDCEANARRMLHGKFSSWAGSFNDYDYYLCDGKLWSIHRNGHVFRCDDEEEKQEIMGVLRRKRAQ
jgi:hypothetical protein